jgi:hypothetical protein
MKTGRVDTAQLSGTITKAELKVLGKMFAAEIEYAMSGSRLPPCFQSRAKSMQSLHEKGLIAPVNFRVGNDALAVHVEGWELTHAGRAAYCATC